MVGGHDGFGSLWFRRLGAAEHPGAGDDADDQRDRQDRQVELEQCQHRARASQEGFAPRPEKQPADADADQIGKSITSNSVSASSGIARSLLAQQSDSGRPS